MPKSPSLMKPHRQYFFAILGVAAFCVAMNSAALTLGRAKGAVFLGQALRLTVPVQLETGEGGSALCFEADVFYGDTRQDVSRVSVSSELQPQSQSARVTVSAQSPVDEPVVTVYLRAGCGGKTTRRYVLLAELAGSVVSASTGVTLPQVASESKPSPTTRRPQAQSRINAVPRTAKPEQVAEVDAAASAHGASPAPAQGIAKSREVPSRRAQLKLEPLDLTQDRDPPLKLSTELLVEEGDDLQKRARAEVVWRSLNTTQQDIKAIDSRQQSLASDLANLQNITAKNRQLLDDMIRRLDSAESGRFANPLVYGIFLALVACGLAIAWLLSRARRSGLNGEHWWSDKGLGDKSETVESPEGEVSQTDSNAGSAGVHSEVSLAAASEVYIEPQGLDPERGDHSKKVTRSGVMGSERAALSQKLSRAAGQADFGHSISTSLLRSVNSKEMLDVRQQAEFFMTLGQHEEAIALLQDSIDAGPDANPLVYLELLKVLHTLGRKAEYDHYRSGFNAIFNGHVPVYTEFSQSGSGLEAYPPVCRRIVELWPTEEAVSYIENCLARTRMDSGAQDFDLEAFRDLLMLHGVASRIVSSSFDSGFMPFSAAKAAPTPVFAAPQAGVDLDLSEPLDGNLIDFDTSGWSLSEPGGAK